MAASASQPDRYGSPGDGTGRSCGGNVGDTAILFTICMVGYPSICPVFSMFHEGCHR